MGNLKQFQKVILVTRIYEGYDNNGNRAKLELTLLPNGKQ